MSVGDVTLEEVIEAVQEALVSAQADGAGQRWDELEREAFAHDAATGYVARRARSAIEAGEAPMDVAAEGELIRRAIAAYFHAGKFQALLDLDGVTDIMVNAHDTIWLQRIDGFVERHHGRVFADADDLRAEVAHLARRAGGTERRFDDAKPLLVLRLPDGSRLAAIMNVSQVPQVAIRRNVLPDATLDELEQRGTIDRGMHSLLAASMVAGMRVVVSGETGAGKTTLLRAMTNELPPETRMVVIEDTRELNLAADPRRAGSVLEWETREANIEGVGEIAQRELVRHALRFNPRWLIVGEVRDGDAAREMLLAMQHGHPSLSTVHHHSALSAWKKLAQYVAQGSEAVEFSIAALLISDAVDFFVHLGRDRQGRRAVTEICEVAGWNGTEVQLNRVYVPGSDGRGCRSRTCPMPGGAKLPRRRLRRPPPPRSWRVVHDRIARRPPRCRLRHRRVRHPRRLARAARPTSPCPTPEETERGSAARPGQPGAGRRGAHLLVDHRLGGRRRRRRRPRLADTVPARVACQPAAPARPLRGDGHLGGDAARPARVQRRPARGDRQVGSRRPTGHPRRGARPVRTGPAR